MTSTTTPFIVPPGDVVTIRADASGWLTITTAPAEPPRPDAIDPAIARILNRFATRNSDVWAVYTGALRLGYSGHAPEPKRQLSNERYVRMEYKGSRCRVSLLLNSAYFICSGVDVRDFAATLPGVDVRTEAEVPNVHIRYDGTQTTGVYGALENLDRLVAFANGNAS